MSKHTPGPWIIVSETAFVGTAYKDERSRWAHGCALIAEVIPGKASNGEGRRSVWDAECEANARLIAASPELLALVERAVADRIDDAWLSCARAAITKARS